MMVLSTGIFAWVMGSIGSLFAVSDSEVHQLKDKIQKINAFLVANQVPQSFKIKVRRYLENIVE